MSFTRGIRHGTEDHFLHSLCWRNYLLGGEPLSLRRLFLGCGVGLDEGNGARSRRNFLPLLINLGALEDLYIEGNKDSHPQSGVLCDFVSPTITPRLRRLALYVFGGQEAEWYASLDAPFRSQLTLVVVRNPPFDLWGSSLHA